MQFEARASIATKLYSYTAREQTSEATKKCVKRVSPINNITMDEQNKLSVPLAIVVAGIIIAGAIYFSGRPAPQPTQPTDNGNGSTVPTSIIAIPPITEKDRVLGNPNAPIVFVEYSDTECPFCKVFHVTMHSLIGSYGKTGQIAWAYRHFPLYKGAADNPPLHSKAGKEAEALECASDQGGSEKFWMYLDRIFSVTPSNNGLDPAELPKIAGYVGLDLKSFTTCLDSGKYAEVVAKSYDEAVAAGGRGTPYTIALLSTPLSKDTQAAVQKLFVGYPPDILTIGKGGKTIAVSGALPIDLMKSVIDTLLKK